jgi:hypothetical protein
MSACFHLIRDDLGSAVIVWKGGSTRVFAYSVSEDGIELEAEADACLPVSAALIRRNHGAMGASVWLIRREDMSVSDFRDPLIQQEASDARRFHLLAALILDKRNPSPAMLAAKTVGDLRAAVDAALLATDEFIPPTERKR